MAAAFSLDNFRLLFGGSEYASSQEPPRDEQLASLWAVIAQVEARKLGAHASVDAFRPLGEVCAALPSFAERRRYMLRHLNDAAKSYIGFRDGDGI